MRDDYKSEAEREAYSKGVIAHINGLTIADNPYILRHNRRYWLKGFNEKGSIKDKSK